MNYECEFSIKELITDSLIPDYENEYFVLHLGLRSFGQLQIPKIFLKRFMGNIYELTPEVWIKWFDVLVKLKATMFNSCDMVTGMSFLKGRGDWFMTQILPGKRLGGQGTRFNMDIEGREIMEVDLDNTESHLISTITYDSIIEEKLGQYLTYFYANCSIGRITRNDVDSLVKIINRNTIFREGLFVVKFGKTIRGVFANPPEGQGVTVEA